MDSKHRKLVGERAGGECLSSGLDLIWFRYSSRGINPLGSDGAIPEGVCLL